MPRKTTDTRIRHRSSAVYSSKIIKAGALIGDTKTLLSHWDIDGSIDENIRRIQRENIFGKASRSRVEDILAIFRQRYLTERSVTKALVTLVRGKFPAVALERLLYFHSAWADQVLHDAVTDVIVPMRERGLVDIGVHDIQRALREWVEQGKTVSSWSEITIIRVAQELLATLRDFGVLQGAAKKRIVPPFFPVESFAYVAFYLKQHQPSGAKLIELPHWKLFFMHREAVERLLFEAHQQGLLEYHAAGNVKRGLDPASVAYIVKKAARRAGFRRIGDVSGHSFRSGHVSQAVRNGLPEYVVMKQTGHKSREVLSAYIRMGELFDQNPAQRLWAA